MWRERDLKTTFSAGTLSANNFMSRRIPPDVGITNIPATEQNINQRIGYTVSSNGTLVADGERLAVKALLELYSQFFPTYSFQYLHSDVGSPIDGRLKTFGPDGTKLGLRPVELKFSLDGTFKMTDWQYQQCIWNNALIFVLTPPAKSNLVTYTYKLGCLNIHNRPYDIL